MNMGGGSVNNGTGMGMAMPPTPSSSSSSSSMANNGNGTMNGNGMGGGGGGHNMMAHMTFFWGHQADILFSGWPGNRQGVGMYILALLLVFAASALVEFLSSYIPRLSRGPTTTGAAKGLLLTAIAAVRTALSYLVMLSVMSFNVGVLIAAIAGHALGFFVFGSGIFVRQHQDILPNRC